MKHFFSIIVLFFACCFCFAQESKHMTFMGIPMGGTIDNFQIELSKKNVAVSPDSKNLPSGLRLFKGKFSGQTADIMVWYNERSKLVYRGKALIERSGKELALQILSSMEDKLDIKYGTEGKEVGTFKDDHLHELRSVSYVTNLGRIDLFIIGDSYTDTGDFTLHIDYHDLINDALNTLDEMDDL